MKLKDVLKTLNRIAPADLAEKWDNCGLMIGDEGRDIKRIAITLDPGFEAIEFAMQSKADLLITHHPLFFEPIKSLNLEKPLGKKISLLIKSNIALVSLHTNLDSAQGGIADIFVSSLGLKTCLRDGPVRIGAILKPQKLRQWAAGLPFENIRIVDSRKPVQKVCACPGSGMDYLDYALASGCDTLVTGDVRYHKAFDALEAGINIVDTGHFASEQIAVKPFAVMLRKKLKGMDVIELETKDIFTYIKKQGEKN